MCIYPIGSVSLENPNIVSHFIFSHSREYIVLSHCCLICISLKTNDVDHLFMCSFATHRSSLVNCLFKSFAPFKKWRVFFFSLSFESSLYILHTSPLSDIICNFTPVCALSFHSLNSFFRRAEVFNLDEVQFINVCFYRLHFLCLI